MKGLSLLKKVSKNVSKRLMEFFVILIMLLLFGCGSSFLQNSTGKSSAKKLINLALSYNGNKQDVDLSNSMKITLPILPLFGGTSKTSTLIGTAAAIKMSIEVSPKATYIISSKDTKTLDKENINLNDLSLITIKVIAEDDTTKNYTLTLNTTFTKEAGFTITNTYASRGGQTQSTTNDGKVIVGQGLVDNVMSEAASVVTVFNLAPNTMFNWKIKNALNNKILTEGTSKTPNDNTEINILKSDFNALTKINTKTELILELSTDTPDNKQTATQTIIYSPYEIFTWYDLQAMRLDRTGDYFLRQNIIFPDADTENFSAKGFEPIGSGGQPFTGSFDGNKNTIKNFAITRNTENYIGLFGKVNGSSNTKVIKNFTLNHVGIEGKNYVGAIAGHLENGTIVNVLVSSETKTVSGESEVGGLVGKSDEHSKVIGYTTGTVSGNIHVGGLVGYSDKNSEVIGYTTGPVIGGTAVGGLVGLNVGTVKGYVRGIVNGNIQVGGLVGSNNGTGTVEGYARGMVKRIANSGLEIGLVAGKNSTSGTLNVHHSATESKLVDGITDSTITGSVGSHGIEINYGINTTEEDFSNFTFGTEVGEWTFETGKWPAINIDTISTSKDQPTDFVTGENLGTKELSKITVTYDNTDYNSAKESDDNWTLEVPVTQLFGATVTDFVIGNEVVVKTIESSGININKKSNDLITLPSTTTIKVTAKNGTEKEYTFTITTVSNILNFSILNTYASEVQTVLGQGIVENFIQTGTAVITISNVAKNTNFDWKIKNASDNVLLRSTLFKTSNDEGEINILKSDFTAIGTNTIKNLITSDSPEAILSLELNPTAALLDIQTKTITYSPYKIFTWYDLQAMREDFAGNYVLQKDITFPNKGIDGFPVEGFAPIGSVGQSFTGGFDGKGYTISKFSIERSTENYVGLFGQVNTGVNSTNEIKNFTLNHVGIEGKDRVAALVGNLKTGNIIDVKIAGQELVKGINFVGGLVGKNAGTVENSGANVIVEGVDSVGGLVGYNESGEVTGYTTGSVTGTVYIGGLVGYDGGGTVIGYVTGAVSGNNEVGGLVGHSEGTVTGYATGVVTGISLVGGLVGANNKDNAVTGYARGKVIRKNDKPNIERTFGLLTGFPKKTHTAGYRSSKTNESKFVGIELTGLPGSGYAAGYNGTKITIDANTTETDFQDLAFDTAVGKWTFIKGKWPAITIGTIAPISAQPSSP